MKIIEQDLSKKILTIGPDYHNHRGGIGAVIEIYSKYFENFKFLPSYRVASKLFKTLFFLLFCLRFLTVLLIDRKIKIIHIHGASYGSFYRKFVCFIIAKYLFSKKIIYHIHGAEYQLFYKKSDQVSRRLIHLLIESSDLVICLSTEWCSFFNENFSIKCIEILPNIIDYAKPVKLIKIDTSITFLFLGFIGNRKGIFDLLEILKNNKAKYSGKIKLIIGGNGEVERLKKIIKQNDLNGLIEFVGWVTDVDKIKLLELCDIYILPSYNEGLPISILEAMSYGKPIISTNIGGIPEIVKPNKNGFLIEPGNLSQIESVVDFCIENRNLLIEYGKESKLMVEKHLPNNVLMELNKIYLSLLHYNE